MKDDFKPLRPAPAFVPVQEEPTGGPVPRIQNLSVNEGPITPPSEELPEIAPATPPRPPQKRARGPKAMWRKFQKLPRNKKIIVVSALAGLLIFGGALAWYYTRPEPTPPPPPPVAKEEPLAPSTVPSPLTGVQVEPALAKLPVTGVMIENSPDARPQSGLYNAGVVYEAIAEGGITRFLTLFQEAKPEYIGPVRSVRPYYLDLLAPYDAPIAHAGGSAQALAKLRNENFKDLEAFQNPNYYQRVSNRYAPHNLYTGRSKLLELQKSKGWNTSKFTGFERKEKEEKAATPTAKTIDLSISGFYYNPQFVYNAKNNSYLRNLAGRPHMDERAKKQIQPKVVVVLVMKHSYAGVYSVYGTQGKGTAYIFQDGLVKKGTWHKGKRKSQLKFTDKSGKTIGLNPGKTWVTLVSSPDAVTYKP